MRRSLLAAAAASTLLLMVGCSAPEPAPTAPPEDGPTELTGSVTVFAAASLQVAFDELAAAFESENEAIDLRPIVYDGSSTLVTQLTGGASADVFASADEATMTTASDVGLIGPATPFATNTLVVALPPGNPAGIRSLDDLARGADVVLCAPEVPCGAASRTLLADAGVTVTPASLEQNVTAVLTKVAAGEADAGLVYATDVAGRTDVESFAPDGAEDVVNRYPIAVLTESAAPAAADAFIDFVLSDAGQDILRDHGFGAP